MKKISLFLYTLVVNIGLIIFGLPVYASQQAACEDDKIKSADISLMGMIKKATFIGVYHASKVDLTQIELDNNAGLLALTQLSFSGEALKGDPPSHLNLHSAPGLVPPYYYATIVRHDKVNINRPALSGRIPLVSSENESHCFFIPHFSIGFSYLIFGGIDTPMSYEVLLDAQYDTWYHMVVENVKTLSRSK